MKLRQPWATYSIWGISCLCLLGFHPQILSHALQSSGATLRYLHFHIRENAADLRLGLGPSFPTLLLSARYLETLRSTCPLLEWLGLDITQFDLVDEEGRSAALSTNFNSIQAPPNPPFIATLAEMPSLRHIRLFLHHEQYSHWSLSSTMAISEVGSGMSCRRRWLLLWCLCLCISSIGIISSLYFFRLCRRRNPHRPYPYQYLHRSN